VAYGSRGLNAKQFLHYYRNITPASLSQVFYSPARTVSSPLIIRIDPENLFDYHVDELDENTLL